MLSALSLAVVVSLVTASGLIGQESHVVDRAELDRATAERTVAEDARRDAIRSVLQRPEVRSTAETHGLDITRAEDAVATLEGEALAGAFAQAQRIDKALAGGADAVVISTTTLIIVLLIVLILVVA
jgi:hypothetical protein